MTSGAPISRRSLLGAASGLAAAGLTATALAGCGSGVDSGPGTASSPVALPAQLPYDGATPDLKGTAAGVPDAYFGYPADPVASVTGPPGSGAAVTALLSSYAVSPTPAPANTYLVELNRQLNVDLQLQVTPAADYAAKLSTTVSGGKLPDLIEMLPSQPQLPQLLGAVAADLTPHLAGEAIKDYPNLATFSADMWRTTIFDNRIHGLPVPRPIQSGVPFIRSDLFRQRGLDPDPKSWEEFRELCAALTAPKESRYALSMPPIAYLNGALGGLNEWGELDGTLVRWQETEQYQQALSWTAELAKAGFLHPDAFAANATVLGKQRLVGGQIGIHPDGYSAWGSLARFLPEGEQEVIGGLTVRGFAGATPTYAIGAGSTNFTVLAKADEARIVELLKILNFLAAPFGSAEFLFRKYGSAGEQHSVEGDNPVLSKRGTDEITPVTEALDYHLVDGVKVAYEGSLTKITQAKHDFAVQAEPGYARSAVIGLYSETNARTGNQFNRTLTDLQNGVITGRKTVEDLAAALQSWNSGDGQKIKAEFAAARDKQ
ncbi:extracellular solute-binding protein [Microlunatus speluncae]|uniref:extracellular solute-binding protein n=1 Tax=Microlunatus speluncae TaxID=2594267 RepID=UPI0012664617|nr:extracellular solute-binding protein [Microlunatus speluncae]